MFSPNFNLPLQAKNSILNINILEYAKSITIDSILDILFKEILIYSCITELISL